MSLNTQAWKSLHTDLGEQGCVSLCTGSCESTHRLGRAYIQAWVSLALRTGMDQPYSLLYSSKDVTPKSRSRLQLAENLFK